MDHILLCTNHIPPITTIYNSFIEDYMPAANGSYVKVYLYIAKCLQAKESNFSISSLADQLENTEKDILRALMYWEKKGLMSLSRDKATGEILGLEMLIPFAERDFDTYENTAKESAASLGVDSDLSETGALDRRNSDFSETGALDRRNSDLSETGALDRRNSDFSETGVLDRRNSDFSETDAANTPTYESSGTDAPSNVNSDVHRASNSAQEKNSSAVKPIQVSPEQIQELSANEDFVWVCNVVESYLERPMKPTEIQLITYLYGTLHFSRELILHLYDYCISMGKTACNYIQTVALSWHEQGIKTPEQAQNASVRYLASYNAVSKALGLGRGLAEIEKKYVDHWQNDWNMDLSVILEACNRTVLKLHHADFKYTEGILSHWNEQNVRTLQGVEQSDLHYAQTKEQKEKKKPSTSGKQPPRNQFQNFKQRDVSSEELQELERKLLMQ
ncbi:DnaD domain protein [Clostridium sp. OM05-6BH]|uniref:DnaD domain protein n=1 Tax=unclassified Clostridium TaxID=2614128 RepID=UPI000E4F4C03|nr:MULTISPECIES: DnaD domain protein [unclassified Clostridium]RHV15834.1 DnaD domain protein [Clostridium sp. OM05-9BH]RHV20216.1 DnaD domain protein [Clostridium sp. OM05-6BH]